MHLNFPQFQRKKEMEENKKMHVEGITFSVK